MKKKPHPPRAPPLKTLNVPMCVCARTRVCAGVSVCAHAACMGV